MRNLNDCEGAETRYLCDKSVLSYDYGDFGDKTITFTFKPSRMFIHNGTGYYFTPTNLVGKRSNKTPDPVYYTFSGKNVVCSKIFNDGRLYINAYGTPNILDTSNLAVNDLCYCLVAVPFKVDYFNVIAYGIVAARGFDVKLHVLNCFAFGKYKSVGVNEFHRIRTV